MMNNTPFIIYSLPRSRTAWLAAFLTYGEWTCYHEHAINMRSMDDVVEFFAQPNIGAVETGIMQGWWLLRYHVPNIRMVVIHRPVNEVIKSLLATDVSGVATYDEQKLWRIMPYGARMLRQIGEVPGVLNVEFDELESREGCQRIWDFVLPYPFDDEWWELMKDENITVDMKAFLTKYFTIKDQVEDFKKQCRTELRRLRRSGVDLRNV
jgi:hypothetical protein